MFTTDGHQPMVCGLGVLKPQLCYCWPVGLLDPEVIIFRHVGGELSYHLTLGSHKLWAKRMDMANWRSVTDQ